MKYRYINVTYSAKTNPEVMAFQSLVRNYALQLKKYDMKIKYIKNIRIPFKLQLYDKYNKLRYETYDYRRLKFMIRRVGFFKDIEPKSKKNKINEKTKEKTKKSKKTKKNKVNNKTK
jgi:hypothetical protein